MADNSDRQQFDGITRKAYNIFSNHALKQIANHADFKSWYCGSPNTGAYSFTISVMPNYLIVSGDIGFLALSRTYDMVSWLNGAINDPYYIAEKVPLSIQVRTHNEKGVREFIEFIQAQNLDYVANSDLIDSLDDIDSSDSESYYALVALDEAGLIPAELLDQQPIPERECFTIGFMYQYAALKWWLTQLKANGQLASACLVEPSDVLLS